MLACPASVVTANALVIFRTVWPSLSVMKRLPALSSATRWYVAADATEIDGLEYAYLAGGEGPQVESKSDWDVDGVDVRVILDFGAGFIDWRGWYQNAGA